VNAAESDRLDFADNSMPQFDAVSLNELGGSLV
jgi:hypothetical protein